MHGNILTITGLLLLISKCPALFPANSGVVILTPYDINKYVEKSDEVWMVIFFAPLYESCKRIVPDYIKAANALKGIVKVGAIDVIKHDVLRERFHIYDYPSIKIFSSNLNKPALVKGHQTAKALVDSALSAIHHKTISYLSNSTRDVIELSDDNFDKLVLQTQDMWMVEFFLPSNEHCKDLVSHWEQAAAELKGKINLGAVDASKNNLLISKYHIHKFPKIKFFPAGKKKFNSASDYGGGYTSTDIVNWALDKFRDKHTAPKIIQITSKEMLQNNCIQKPLCIVTFLPYILDCSTDCQNAYLDTLRNFAIKYKYKLWGWYWGEAGAEPSLESALGIDGSRYPVMVAIDINQMKYSLLTGLFSNDAIKEFLKSVSEKKVKTSTLNGVIIPKISGKSWGAEDGDVTVEDVDTVDVSLHEKDEL